MWSELFFALITANSLLFQSARTLQAALFGQELALALQQVSIRLSQTDEATCDQNVDRRDVLLFGSKLKKALRDIWEDPAVDVFNVGSDFCYF